MSTEIEETEVQRTLYAGCMAGFDRFLQRLAQITRATGAEMAVGVQGRWSFGQPPGLPEGALREGRVYAQGDLPGSDPMGPPLRMLAASGGVRLAIGRQRDAFRATDAALLSRLTPHLETTAVLWRQRQADVARAAREGMLAAGLGGGWLVLDQGLRVVEASVSAGGMLARAGLTAGADGRLDLPPETARALRRAVDAALAGKPAMVILSAEPRIEAAVRPEGGQVLALLRAAPQARDLPGLAEALGITRSEARLVAALADGATLVKAAEALGWSVETARSTSKQVFSKLGVAGQPALIRRVLNGAQWLTG